MMRAVWNGHVVAEAPRTVVVEGNHYFPPGSLRSECFMASATTSLCPWKGVARYYTLAVAGRVNPDAAWYYPRPSPLGRRIKDHVAFRHGVQIEGPPEDGAAGPQAAEPAYGRDRRPRIRARTGGVA